MTAPLGLIPHHDGSELYVSNAAPSLGEEVTVRVRIPRAFGPVTAVKTRSNPDHEPRFSDAVLVSAGSADGWDWWEASVEVENPVHGYRFLIFLADGTQRWLNASGLHAIETLDFDDFKLLTAEPPPVWAASSVMYQIFPDRFARSAAADSRALPEWTLPAEWTDEPINIGPDAPRQFFGGDLQGIAEHLDHLTRLGVTLIYLTPIFPARSNHRYDALSFDEVDELLGGDEAFIALVEAAHARGLRVVGDLTSNHSGDAHKWFQAAHRHPEAPESDFYLWKDAEQNHYVSWLGVSTLPKFNWKSTELRRRFIEGPDSVVAKWLKAPYNLDGWRIDVANMTGRYLDEDLNAEVRQIIRKTMVAVNPDTILLGESTNDALGDFQGDAWHGAMTYANFTRPLWGWLSKRVEKSWFFGLPYGTIPHYSGHEVFAAHQQFSAGFPWRVRLHNMNAIDTHDTARFLTSALDGALPVAFGLSVTLPGIPVIFAGDEFALTGDDGEHSRSPIPWQNIGDAAETIDLYSTLIHLRTGHVALNAGGIRWLHVDDDVLVFIREHAAESILVVAARASFTFTLPVGSVVGSPELLFGDASAVPTGAVSDAGSGAGRNAAADAGLTVSGGGPSFNVWQLPGVSAAEV